MTLEEEISKLATKAEKTDDSADALRFSQAALNLANAANTFKHTKLVH